MKTSLALLVVLLGLSACSGGEEDAVATDPAPTSAVSEEPAADDNPVPTQVPVAAGEVRTRNLITVMDTGQGAELCLGAIAESFPPQCGGPAIPNWDWKTLGQGIHETQGDVRWGSYVLTGTWDGTEFTASSAVPAALYDPAVVEPTQPPAPATTYPAAELQAIGERLATELPGVQGSYGGEGTDGHVLVDVTYDDGTLQQWADAEYGAGVVLITAALLDA